MLRFFVLGSCLTRGVGSSEWTIFDHASGDSSDREEPIKSNLEWADRLTHDSGTQALGIALNARAISAWETGRSNCS